MSGLFRRVLSSAIAVSFVLVQSGPELTATSSASPLIGVHAASLPHTIVAHASPPVRVPVPEPPRPRFSPPPLSAMRPKAVPAVRPLNGRHVPGPPMLQPTQIDGVLKAASAAAHRQAATAGAAMSVPTVTVGRRVGSPGSAGSRPAAPPGVRRAQSLPSDPNGSGTGINPWWRYQEERLPGGGHVMANVGTGNLLVQDDDMAVPHKGVAMAFRRTYNSQASGPPPGSYKNLYGNGWTNTFDAHIVRTSSTAISVYDIDGARYDYVQAGGVWTSATAGQHASLAFDGGCGYTWTKKSGTIYYFYTVDAVGACVNLGGFAGRIYQIIGRNRYTYITFYYSWDNGDSSATGKINAITSTTESGMSATLTFADVNGRRLLQQLTFPDAATSVQYGYDASGNLASVSLPPNNATGNRPLLGYAYRAIGSDSILYYYVSPRYNLGCQVSGCNSDGSVVIFAFAGSSASSSTLSYIGHNALLNPTIPDGTSSGAIQPGYPTSVYATLQEYFTTGVSTSTYRDNDGHMTNWVVDGTGRPTQTQECTASANQGQQCTGTWLLLNESWDANNNLVSTVDARGYESDFAYDANGNTIAVGEPSTTSSQGTFRPTKLFDYDAFNNVTAYCDETETHSAGADWVAAPAASDSLCSSRAVAHATFTFSYPSYQPYGQLTTMTTPLGYARQVTYAAAQQAGTDYGLPTSVTGTQFQQLDGSWITPTQSLWYDGAGNLRCYGKGQGTWVLSYDTLGRITSAADPDDSSANAGSACGKSTGRSGWNTQTTYTYYADGARASAQSPSERAFGVSTTSTYDLDGNLSTQTDHHGCVTGQSCVGGLTRKWYDGIDRLVEVAQPNDSKSDSILWNLRYLYDLSAGSGVNIAGGSASFAAYGNLYKTQSWVPGGWTDQKGSAFDALDREVQKFSYHVTATDLGSGALQSTLQAYDSGSPATLGLLTKKTNPNGESVTYAYDERGKIHSQTYTGENGITPAETYVYDPVSRVASITSSVYGAQFFGYDADGRLVQTNEPSGGGLTDPAPLNYSYYPNGEKSALSVTSATFTQANAIAYSYRVDGVVQTQRLNAFGGGTWNKTYTDTGRPLTLSGVASETFAYDGAGQVLSYGVAGGGGLQLGRDPEGSVLTSAETANNGATTIATQTNTLNQRGELYDQVWNPNPYQTMPHRHASSTSGYLSVLTIPLPTEGNPDSTPCGDAPDLLNGTRVELSCPSAPVQYGAQSFPQGSDDKYSFDATGRAVNHVAGSNTFRTVQAPPHSTTNKNWSVTTTTSSTYDAENHLHAFHPVKVTTITDADTFAVTTTTVDHGAATLGWGPTGHPVTVQNLWNGDNLQPDTTLHWDGDVLLFVTNSSGTVVDFKIGIDGEISPTDAAFSGLIAFDRDQAGMVLQCNSTSGNSGFVNPDETTFAAGLPCGPGGQSFIAPIRSYFSYIRADGLSGLPVQINGVRAYDPTLGTWTTPDAFEGDVHDPASQQKYMWNRGNPVDYSDPSGYEACAGPVCLPTPLTKILSGAGRAAAGAARAAVSRAGSVALKGVPIVGWASLFVSLGGSTDHDTEGAWLAQQASKGNTDPYKGPVDEPVTAVDSHGNAIPVGEGESIGSSPDGQYQEVKGRRSGETTGTQLHRGGHPKQKDPKAQAPHGHRPGVTDASGNPHLPVH
jgi:RHS repeat-associated protein